MALPYPVVVVAEVVRDVAWRKTFKLAISPRGKCRVRDRDKNKPVREVEGVDSMLKLASSFRMAINEREMMLQIQLTVVMGRELEAGEAEIEERYRSKAHKSCSLEEVLVSCPILLIPVYSRPDLSFCFLLFLPRLFHHLSARNFGSLCFPVIRAE